MVAKSIEKTIFSVTFITLFARMLSFLNVQIYISKFGFDNIYLQIFIFALMLPNILFTAVGTILTTMIVPTYASLVDENKTEEAKNFLDNIISISSIFMLCLVLIGICIAPILAKLSGFSDEPALFSITVKYIRFLMPIMFFYGISFIFQGILQSHGKFNLIAMVTVPTSLLSIVYVVFFGDIYGINGLLVVTFIALASQTIFLLPSVISTGYRFKPSFDFKDKYIKNCFKTSMPILLGVFSYQFNTLFNSFVATNFNISQINLVQNIILTSVLAFIYSLTAIYYPKLSVLWSQRNYEEYKKSILDVISVLIFLLLPITFGFIAVRYSLFNFISNYGAVTNEDIIILGNLLALYSLGILAIGLKEVIDRIFYSQKNTKISALVGFIIMISNVVCTLVLVKYIGIYAMPLSYAISTNLGVLLLLFILRRKIDGFGKDIFIFSLKCLFSSILMFIIVTMETNILNNLINDTTLDRFIKLFLPVISGVAVYLGMTYILKIEQLKNLVNSILKRI